MYQDFFNEYSKILTSEEKAIIKVGQLNQLLNKLITSNKNYEQLKNLIYVSLDIFTHIVLVENIKNLQERLHQFKRPIELLTALNSLKINDADHDDIIDSTIATIATENIINYPLMTKISSLYGEDAMAAICELISTATIHFN